MIPFNFYNEKILFYHRIGSFLYRNRFKKISTIFESIIYRKYNCIISNQAVIGKNLKLNHPIGVVIGTGVIIGNNVVIYQNVTLGRKKMDTPDYPIIEDNVTIYANSIVVGKIIVRENSIILANQVVSKTVNNGKKVIKNENINNRSSRLYRV